ncbi:hypothetical protein ACFX1S_047585 [Malus domestica]
MKKRKGWWKSQIIAITLCSKFKEVEEETKEKGGNGISGMANPAFIFSIAVHLLVLRLDPVHGEDFKDDAQ